VFFPILIINELGFLTFEVSGAKKSTLFILSPTPTKGLLFLFPVEYGT
jgi:hypothetical protein